MGATGAFKDVIKRDRSAEQALPVEEFLELYYLGLWMTPEFPLLIANAPDTDAFTMDDSEHYAHWAQNFADETGYLRDPNHVLMNVAYTRALHIPDEELKRYVPMPRPSGRSTPCSTTAGGRTRRRSARWATPASAPPAAAATPRRSTKGSGSTTASR